MSPVFVCCVLGSYVFMGGGWLAGERRRGARQLKAEILEHRARVFFSVLIVTISTCGDNLYCEQQNYPHVPHNPGDKIPQARTARLEEPGAYERR